MRREILISAVACAGCNQVYGIDQTFLLDAAVIDIDAPVEPALDRDRDEIPDVEDSCIASIADAKVDWEGDGYANEIDPCPFDYESFDTDGDAIFDDCDPFVMQAGDRVRCVMAFQSPTINVLLWRPRETGVWNQLAQNGMTGIGTGTLVATEQIEAPITTSYDASFYASAPIAPATHGSLTLWLRTNTTPSPSDVGCEIRGDATTSTLTLRGAATTMSVPVARRLLGSWKLQATVEPAVSGRSNVRCVALYYSTMWNRATVAAEIALPAGFAGVSVADVTGTFAGLLVVERDDAPDL